MNAEVHRRIGPFLDDLEASPAGDGVLAVVVAGSAGRGEEIWRDGSLVSDIDLMVVTEDSSLRRRRIVDDLVARHGGVGIEGGCVPLRPLSRYRTLAHYEARERGTVVHGDAGVLRRIPIAGPEDIPAWEGMRLVLNRTLEHVKHRTGSLPASTCVAKSYEALGEAQLVAEGRYRPSFHERWDEAERRPLGGPVARLQERYLATRDFRERGTALDVAPAEALADLLAAAGHAVSAETGEPAELGRALDRLAARERHVAHRVFWALLGGGPARERLRALVEDPAIRIWRAAVELLTGRDERTDPARLLDAWRRCPQILRAGPGR